MRDDLRHKDTLKVMLQRREGVVMIAALWICALIMWIALQIATETRMKGEEQVHLFRKSQAMHLAIGGSYEALARMAQANSLGLDRKGGHWKTAPVKHKGQKGDPEGDDWQPDGEPHLVDFQTGQALVMIESENAKVNVNKANHDQLKIVLERGGLEADEAENLADLILDFTDKDDLVRLHGGEKEFYKNRGLHYGPFNGPLTSLDQMLLIPGVTQQLFYGYGQAGDEPKGKDGDVPTIPGLPSKYSLFRLLTVYGKNVTFKDEKKDKFDDMSEKPVTWEKGGIYRILTCGRTFAGPPTVILWLVVRYAPEAEAGYEVLYRKTL